MAPFDNFQQAFSDEDKKLTAAYQSMIEDKVKPAYLQLHDFMNGELYGSRSIEQWF
ncbi:MAG: hypothetical protein CM15mP59_2400 [Flavobacteriaceae bacterium]|nr:MAG: hypothetical protein CM15mP59_2400 [Flavobacteriaceae bacterium]